MTPRPSEPRERLLRVATSLFYREGIKGVGVDRILSEAGVTRATMYRHFRGKEGLVEAYLELEDATIRGYFAAAASGDVTADEMLTRVVDGIAEDATRYHDRGCPFINAAVEFPDPDSPVRVIISRHRTWFRDELTQVLTAADIANPERAAGALVLLRDATLVGVYLDSDHDVVESFRASADAILGR